MGTILVGGENSRYHGLWSARPGGITGRGMVDSLTTADRFAATRGGFKDERKLRRSA